MQPDFSLICWVQVDILVVNCSLFNPTPSLSAMIINHFKMRSNIVSYNLAGMGCSAGVIAVNLAKELLQASLFTNAPLLLLFACRVCVLALACMPACTLMHMLHGIMLPDLSCCTPACTFVMRKSAL